MHNRRRVVAATIAVILGVGWLAWWELHGPPAPDPDASAPASTSDTAAAPAPKNAVPAASTVDAGSAVSPSGVPFRVFRMRRIETPAPPYGPAYAQLRAAAEAGDSAAQYRLGLLLYQCRDVPAATAGLEREIDTIYQTRQRDGWDVADPQVEEQTLRRRHGECEGVPAAERGEYRDWLKRAADAGLLQAQLDLPLHLPPGEYCQYLAECSPAQRARQEALQKEAIDYLGRARDAGSATALWTFGGWYAEGEVVAQNDIEAYANFRALDDIQKAAGESRRFTSLLADLRGRLRPADLAAADARADALLANPNCCVLTP